MKGAIELLRSAPTTEDPRAEPMPTTVIGVVLGAAEDGRPIVSGGGAGPGVAESVWLEPAPDWGASCGVRVALGFLGGDMSRPIVLGCLDRPTPAKNIPVEVPASPAPATETPRVLRLESAEELILECGKAKIALRADGRVTILGGYLLSRSTGAHKIKGASVQIN